MGCKSTRHHQKDSRPDDHLLVLRGAPSQRQDGNGPVPEGSYWSHTLGVLPTRDELCVVRHNDIAFRASNSGGTRLEDLFTSVLQELLHLLCKDSVDSLDMNSQTIAVKMRLFVEDTGEGGGDSFGTPLWRGRNRQIITQSVMAALVSLENAGTVHKDEIKQRRQWLGTVLPWGDWKP